MKNDFKKTKESTRRKNKFVLGSSGRFVSLTSEGSSIWSSVG